MIDLNLNLSKKCGVYIIFNVINGKRYIGSSCELKERLWRHFWELSKGEHINEHLQRSYNKYGEKNFQIGILEYCNIENQLKRESYYIDLINPEYNIREVNASDITKHSEETRKKISDKIKESYKSGKMKEYLNTTRRRSVPCYIYDIEKWALVKQCANFKEADDFLGMKQSVRDGEIANHIFREKYVVLLEKIIYLNDLKNIICKEALSFSCVGAKSQGIKKWFIAIDENNEMHYFRKIPHFIKKFGVSSKSTLMKHNDAVIEKPYIIPNTNIKIFYSTKFIEYSRSKKKLLDLSSGNIGESPTIEDNTEINSEIKKSESSYSVDNEPLN